MDGDRAYPEAKRRQEREKRNGANGTVGLLLGVSVARSHYEKCLFRLKWGNMGPSAVDPWETFGNASEDDGGGGHYCSVFEPQ